MKNTSLFTKMRQSKNFRLLLLLALFIVLAVMYYFFEKFRVFIIGLMLVILVAVGVEIADYDLDLGKLWETGSVEQSRVETITDSEGNKVRLITGKCNTEDFDLNCKDFATQEAAQAKYEECAAEIASNNPGIDTSKLDIYGLDGNNNGIVCESNRKTIPAL